MIDLKDIDNAIVVDESEFQEIANKGKEGIYINVMNIEGKGWVIIGPSGIYQPENGTRYFEDLSKVHKLLAEWGCVNFLQDAVLKEFPL